jgi:hypothetical protein
VKRIIFSLYRNDLAEHGSVPSFKREQFIKYADQLEQKHREYASIVGADYLLIKPTSNDYIEVQFEKLNSFEILAKDYDEVMYIDFDIIPITAHNIFERFDLNTICSFNIQVQGLTLDELRWRRGFNWHSMDMYTKACNKKAMLLLDGISGTQSCINTGVVVMNSDCIRNLNFTERCAKAVDVFKEALNDNFYPEEMTNNWVLNNEVIFSYIIEKYDLPFTNIGMPWNFILDHNEQHMTSAAHLLHFVHKKFELFFG